jgi:AcrR family transcriptional regulator
MGRNPEQNQLARDRQHEAIMSAALGLFASRGPAATKIADIAAAAGISQGLVYHYFPSKDDIFVQLLDRALTRLNTASARLETLVISPADKLKLAMGGLLKGLEEDEDAARTHLLIALASISAATPPAVRAVLERERRTLYETIARIIRAGQAAGTVRAGDADSMAVLFWSVIKGLAIHRAIHGAGFPSPKARDLLRLFLEEEPSRSRS